MTTSPTILKLLAATTWYAGGIILLFIGGSLLQEAHALRPEHPGTWVTVAAGLLAGSLKAHYLFTKSCAKNLTRIDNLAKPSIWLFFRPRFLLFLGLMIFMGASLSRMAQGNYHFLLCVAWLDLGIATALLGSSWVFWKMRNTETLA